MHIFINLPHSQYSAPQISITLLNFMSPLCPLSLHCILESASSSCTAFQKVLLRRSSDLPHVIALSFRVHCPELPIVQCQKTIISYILSNILVAYDGNASHTGKSIMARVSFVFSIAAYSFQDLFYKRSLLHKKKKNCFIEI